MKLPVPAAQTLFMTERVTRPSRRVVNFESWPPISMMVSTSGCSSTAARAWAVISSRMRSAPRILPMNFRPAPVVPAPRILSSRPFRLSQSATASRMSWVATRGFPAVEV